MARTQDWELERAADALLRDAGEPGLTHSVEECRQRRWGKRMVRLDSERIASICSETREMALDPRAWWAIRKTLEARGIEERAVTALEARFRYQGNYEEIAAHVGLKRPLDKTSGYYSERTLRRFLQQATSTLLQIVRSDPYSWVWMLLVLKEVFGEQMIADVY